MKVLLLLLFWCLWFFNFSSRTILSPLLPIFENQLGISHTLAGSLLIFLSAGYVLSLLMAGWMEARLGPKKSIASANLIFIISLVFLRLGDSFGYFASVAFFMGLGTGLYLPSAVPLLTSIFRPETWGKTFSFHETASSFSFLAIPLLTALSLRFFDWKSYILVFAGVCMLVSLTFVMLAPDPPIKRAKGAGYARLLVRKEFWIIAAMWCSASSSVLAIFNVVPLLLVHERGVPLETANAILGISRIGGVVATFVIGFLVDRYGPRKMLFVSLFFAGVATLGVALSRDLLLMVVALIFQAAFSLMFFPIGLVALSKLTDPQDRSLFTGAVASTSVIVGNGFAPFAMGVAGDLWSFQTGILVLGVVVTFSCLLLIPLGKLKR